MGLTPLQLAQLNSLLRSRYQEFLALQDLHTTRSTDQAGKLLLDMKAFADTGTAFRERLWIGIDALLEQAQRDDVHQHLVLDWAFWDFGQTERTVRMWKEPSPHGGTRHIHEDVSPGGSQSQADAAFRPKYKRYWSG